jgi:lysozyme
MKISPRITIFAALLAALAMGGCGGKVERGRTVAGGDSDPHPGVRRAHSLPIQGIDVSKYQGDIDWTRVRDANIRFAYLKVSEGGDHIDNRFYDYWEGAAAAGVPRGAYHFMYWCRTATEQAVWFSQAVPQDSNQLPPVLDLEWNNASPTCPDRVSSATAMDMINVMLRAMERHTGKKPIIYTDINFHKDVLEGELTGYQFWLRSVAAEPKERFRNRPWTIWQYTATGRVPGIAGDVDRNAFIGSEKDWKRWLKANGVQS